MLINWFTVAAQIVNFLILVILLKFLLYDRIIKAMEEREAKIRSRLEAAAAKEEEAAQEADVFRLKNQELDKQRETLLSQAKGAAEAHRKELTEKARHAVDHLKSAWQDAIAREKTTFIQNLKTSTGTQVYSIARRALSDLADADLEDHAIERFLSGIREMDKNERDALSSAVKAAGDEVFIRSAFELSSAQRRKVTKVLREHFNDGVSVQYETRPELIMGIELKVQGRKIAWSLQRYLDDLEANTLKLLNKAMQGKKDVNEERAALKEDPGKKTGDAATTEEDGTEPEKVTSDVAGNGSGNL